MKFVLACLMFSSSFALAMRCTDEPSCSDNPIAELKYMLENRGSGSYCLQGSGVHVNDAFFDLTKKIKGLKLVSVYFQQGSTCLIVNQN